MMLLAAAFVAIPIRRRRARPGLTPRTKSFAAPAIRLHPVRAPTSPDKAQADARTTSYLEPSRRARWPAAAAGPASMFPGGDQFRSASTACWPACDGADRAGFEAKAAAYATRCRPRRRRRPVWATAPPFLTQ